MKYIPYILIALWFILALSFAQAVKEVVGELNTRDRLHSNKISALENKVALCTKEKKALIAEIREITRPLTRLIVVNGWVLGVREETP